MEHEQLTPLAEPPLADNTDNRERILSGPLGSTATKVLPPIRSV